jgi:pteridine reductase
MSDSIKPVRPAVLVTGGARRVGAAIVRRLHADGADVVIHYRESVLAADELADELNAVRESSAQSLQADLNRLDDLARFARESVACFGRLDGLVNNASSFFPTPLGQIGEADYENLLGSNFRAPLFLMQFLAGELRKRRGAIVNLVDIHAERPLAGYPLYSAAKGALATLTRALAIEMAPEVRVNAVAPGPIEWPEDRQFDDEARRAIVAHTLLGRVGRGDEIAAAVAFLLGEATYVTGQILNVDGGRSAHL